MSAKLANNAASRLSVSISNTDTIISLTGGDGAKFPSPSAGDWFPLTLIKATGEVEICKCTERSGDVLTVERGQEGTSNKAFSAGDRAELRLTSGTLDSRLNEKLDKAGGTIGGDLDVTGTLSAESAEINNLVVAGTSEALTAAAGDKTTSIATTQFADRVLNGRTTKDVSASSSIVLTAEEAGTGILVFTGALTANTTVQVPTASSRWIVKNATTGAFTLSVKTAAGGSVTVAQGTQQELFCDGADVLPANNVFTALTDVKWLAQPIGGLISIRDDLTGADAPPTTSASYRYIKLTASDAYNTGVLTSESVSGSAPTIEATAVVSLAGSPMNGQTVDLINTSRRFLRPGSSGTKEESQNASHTHTATQSAHTHTVSVRADNTGTGQSTFAEPTSSTSFAATNDITLSSVAPAITVVAAGGNEARPRSIGATFYMRIK